MNRLNNKITNRILFLLSISGLFISGYLFYKYVFGGPIVCGALQGCDTVRASPYGYPFGIPMPFFGLIFYLIILVGSFIQTLSLEKRYKEINTWLIFIASTLGFIFSIYLFLVEIFIINAICVWCTVSGVIAFLLFLLAVFNLWKSRQPTP